MDIKCTPECLLMLLARVQTLLRSLQAVFKSPDPTFLVKLNVMEACCHSIALLCMFDLYGLPAQCCSPGTCSWVVDWAQLQAGIC